MNRYSSVFIVVVALLFSACGGEEQPVVTPAQQLLSDAGYTEEDEVFVGSYKRYVGTIAGQPVVLNMTQNGDDIKADYYYEKVGKTISLYKIFDSSKLKGINYLEESLPDGSGKNAHWEVLIQADSLVGIWVTGNKKKTYPLLLKEVYPEYIQQFGIIAIKDSLSLRDSTPTPQAHIQYQVLLPIGKDDKSQFVRSVIRGVLKCDTSIRVCLDNIRNNYFEDYKSTFDTTSTDWDVMHFNTYDLSVGYSVVYNEKDILVLNNFTYEYTGGAHGNYSSSFINIDRAEKKQLQLADILTVDSNELLALLDVQARLRFGLNEKQPLEARAFYSELHIPENFYIGSKGITFVYGLYEIASYADGIIELYIPYNKLTNQLTPYFKKRMNLETIAKQ